MERKKIKLLVKVDIQGKIERRVWRGGGIPSKVGSSIGTEKLVDEHENEEWLQKKNEEWEVVKKKAVTKNVHCRERAARNGRLFRLAGLSF